MATLEVPWRSIAKLVVISAAAVLAWQLSARSATLGCTCRFGLSDFTSREPKAPAPGIPANLHHNSPITCSFTCSAEVKKPPRVGNLTLAFSRAAEASGCMAFRTVPQ